MIDQREAIQFCGFGGQGVILAALIFGSTAVTKQGYYAVQTQSFGSEARGGECQAELILSKEPIYSPTADKADILVAMSDLAFTRYVGRLKSGGILIMDPDMVTRPNRPDLRIYDVRANHIGKEIGFAMSSNMVFLGALHRFTGILTDQQLFEGISENVAERFVEINHKAAQIGIDTMSELLKTES
ncbi:MAG TPA: 2-oxoacid:acceptor oxidoreductase family protein [Anaerolineaceae bacterium]|nr:2-oxoacid:acceptor oxidoreductase family protein [Anaerolineaceae bacterium]